MLADFGIPISHFGELCISPVGLSYVSKLAPKRLVGLMFGFWFVCSAIANFLGVGQVVLLTQFQSHMAYLTSSLFLLRPVLAGVLMLILIKP
ncbi:MAG: hypothetical protein CM15mP83_3870 [Flavobacteriaceae bacterium]|nr:MAG: hypothetical protein CM15mP83_3870 [Flavobacteriaceae bacterium]